MSTVPKNPTFVLKTLALLGMVVPLSPVFAQNPNQPLYRGAQPQLVLGVQDGVANAKPKIRHVYLAAPDVLAFVVDAQQMWGGPIQPYVAQPGDQIERTEPQPHGKQGHVFGWNRPVFRDGKLVGNLIGPKEDRYTPVFKIEGEPLDDKWIAKPNNYSLSSPDDVAFRILQTPLAVSRKSNPQMGESTGNLKAEGTVRHEIYLRLPRALMPGKRYTLGFNAGSPFATMVSFTFDDTKLRTEAIQVNQAGYHPRQAEKVARLFGWMGDGGAADLSSFKTFQIVNDKSGKAAFRGEIKLVAAGNPARKMAPEPNADPDNDLPAPLYNLDFSTFNAPGTYRVVVPGLGTSFPFRIDEKVREDAASQAKN